MERQLIVRDNEISFEEVYFSFPYTFDFPFVLHFSSILLLLSY